MKLYDYPQSPNCRKVRLYLAEKGLRVPLQPVNLLAGEQRASEFLRRNPFGAVPILELDDGTVIPESLAIIEYCEELHPLGKTTNHRSRFMVFGSFVSATPVPNEGDVFLGLADTFAASQLSGEAASLFAHLAAQAHGGARGFWLRRLGSSGSEDPALADGPMKRDGARRGLGEIG